VEAVVQEFFDSKTFTMTYIVYDKTTRDAVVIDPVLDFEIETGSIQNYSHQKLLDFVATEGLNVHYLLETHAHADHLSSCQSLKVQWPQAKVAITNRITQVQEFFGPVFGFQDSFRADGSDFDLLIPDNSILQAGSIQITVINTPGHTPACTTFVIGELLFPGDLIFMPDSGTGRCDFPGGDASELYSSVQKVFAFPDNYKIYVGHDYQPGGRGLEFVATVADQKKNNIHVSADQTRSSFIELRQTRDKTLAPPKLLLPSLQVNIRAGKLPEKDVRGRSYINIPLKFSN